MNGPLTSLSLSLYNFLLSRGRSIVIVMSVTVTVSSATLLEEGPKVLLLLLLLPPKTHPRNCKKLSFLFFILSSLENAPFALLLFASTYQLPNRNFDFDLNPASSYRALGW